MSFRSFLFASQTVMAEEGLSFHVETVPDAPAPSPADTKSRNEQSMAMLQEFLNKVPNAPTKKPRRAKR